MKVLAVVLGSEGDMLPFAHLGVALRDRGHQFVLAGFSEFGGSFRANGVDYIELPGDYRALMKRLLGDSKGMMDTVLGIREMISDAHVFDVLEHAMDGVDVVMYTQFSEVARLLGAARGVPSVRVQVFPTEPCLRYSLVDPRKLDGSVGALVTHWMSNTLMAWAMRPVIAAWRRRLGLRQRALSSPPTTIYQFSPALSPPAPEWKNHIHVTGEWLDPHHSELALDPAVEEFVAAGSAPVLASFGSMVSDRVYDLQRWTRDACIEHGLRAIIVDPDHESGVREGILTVARVPFATVLPWCRAGICHGSLGTTGAILRAGKPCLAVAFGGDQHFHANAVCRNGAGPNYIDAQRGELSAQSLAAGIADLVSGAYDSAARRMPELLATDPGTVAAVEIVLNQSDLAKGEK
ncbi:glycosyltransferase [Corynebacterium diphtheriae]|uniref:glycosyltransferase n=1 Tax=Corynebacterium diphtheriae TaxID=1717 RepID=UPI0013C90F08|nr:glycosyltransferase [Corynebacterium diphtheriae]CAB0918210.1 glycosyltransferase [Corynebacterium diphtheriae]